MRNPIAEKRSLRKEAMYWWISLQQSTKHKLTKRHYGKDRRYFSLTGREIEFIYINDPKSSYTEDQLQQNISQLKRKQL